MTISAFEEGVMAVDELKEVDLMAVNLRPKQKAFVDEYLIDLCATQAAIRAGYSKSTAHSIGHENLSKPEIALAIQKAMDARSKRTQLTIDKVLMNIEEVRKEAMDAKNLHAALRASELQGKHLKMFTDKIETNVSGAIYVTTGVSRPPAMIETGGLTHMYKDVEQKHGI